MPKDQSPFVQKFQFAEHVETNNQLRKLILNWSESTPGIVSNMAGGKSFFEGKWLSDKKLHLSDNLELRRLLGFVENAANSLLENTNSNLSVTSMWCMVSKKNYVGRKHNHGGHLSAAYYVDAGLSGEDNGGQLQFFESFESTESCLEITPYSGLLCLFPSRLWHAVSIYNSVQPRIVISANLRLTT